MDEESSQELICGDGHDLLLAARSVVLPAEGDAILLERDETMVGDGDAMGVTSEVVKNVLRSSEGWLGVDDPVLGNELAQELAETFRPCEILERAVELELALEQELPESSRELAAEDATENADGQEEAWGRSNPSGAIEREASSRDDAMHMRMMLQVLSPCMQHTEQADVSSQVLRVACDFEQRSQSCSCESGSWR